MAKTQTTTPEATPTAASDTSGTSSGNTSASGSKQRRSPTLATTLGRKRESLQKDLDDLQSRISTKDEELKNLRRRETLVKQDINDIDDLLKRREDRDKNGSD